MVQEDFTAACRTLFGDELIGLRTLILTPLTPIFEIYAQRARRTSAGWWPSCDLGDGVFAVKCPTGHHGADALWFAPELAECFVLGFCGALGAELRIGEFFCPSQACRQRASCFTGKRVPADHYGILLHADSLHEQQQESFWQAAAETNALCVDMESYPIFRAATGRGVAVASLLIVSDHLIRTPFYRCSTDEIERVRASLAELCTRVCPGSLVDNGDAG
jgi:hypothetical protein